MRTGQNFDWDSFARYDSTSPGKTNGQRPPARPELPYRWSQRWSDDPPIGTIVLGSERVISHGNSDWHPLTDTPNHSGSSGRRQRQP
jgi:hypothetical protein